MKRSEIEAVIERFVKVGDRFTVADLLENAGGVLFSGRAGFDRSTAAGRRRRRHALRMVLNDMADHRPAVERMIWHDGDDPVSGGNVYRRRR